MNKKEENELKSDLLDNGMSDNEITQIFTDLDKLESDTGIEFGESKLFDLPVNVQKEILIKELDGYYSDVEVSKYLKLIDEYHAGKSFTNDGLYLKPIVDSLLEETDRYVKGEIKDKDLSTVIKVISDIIDKCLKMKLVYAYYKKGIDINKIWIKDMVNNIFFILNIF